MVEVVVLFDDNVLELDDVDERVELLPVCVEKFDPRVFVGNVNTITVPSTVTVEPLVLPTQRKLVLQGPK